MTDQYKITSIYYSKPRISRTSAGEVIDYRYGVVLTVGMACDYDGSGFPRKVESIKYDEDNSLFMVYFAGNGLKTIQMQPDMEICYELIKPEKK